MKSKHLEPTVVVIVAIVNNQKSRKILVNMEVPGGKVTPKTTM
jgi:hypothetical protein